MTWYPPFLTFDGMPVRNYFNDDPGVTLEEKVEALSLPDAYPHPPATTIQAIETHMAWVFLTDKHVYKLQKPLRYDFLDLSTVESRRTNCEKEVRLNRRLAADVYLGVKPLVLDESRGLKIAVEGEVVDWLVQMRRLPRERMLDRLIDKKQIGKIGVRKIGTLLGQFYRDAPAIITDPTTYCERVFTDVSDCREKLLHSPYALSGQLVTEPLDALNDFIENRGELLERRADQGWIKEGHGDLRPEHVCIEDEPIIIDCLEFNRDLRILDCADDLALLDMECNELGASFVGEIVRETYREVTGDAVPESLVNFYNCFRACHRAQLAVRHTIGPDADEARKWKTQATRYLELARTYIPGFLS